MRRYLYAGAVAGGLLLFGAAPANADTVPAPAGPAARQQNGGGLGGVLGAANTPLGDSKVIRAGSGDNSAGLAGPGGSMLPGSGAMPAGRPRPRPGARLRPKGPRRTGGPPGPPRLPPP